MSAQAAVIASAPPAAAPPVAPFLPLPATPKISVQEYFELERHSEIRYEYFEGEIIAMPGVSLPHNRISGNFFTVLDRTCEAFIEAVRVRVSPTQYRYPDVVALRGEPITDGENPPALLNPGVIVEVLSASTAAKDKGEKFLEYKQMASLTDYVLAAQDSVSVLHYARETAKKWTITEYTELTDTLTFAALEVTISLADIYRKIVFTAPENLEPAAPAESAK